MKPIWIAVLCWKSLSAIGSVEIGLRWCNPTRKDLVSDDGRPLGVVKMCKLVAHEGGRCYMQSEYDSGSTIFRSMIFRSTISWSSIFSINDFPINDFRSFIFRSMISWSFIKDRRLTVDEWRLRRKHRKRSKLSYWRIKIRIHQNISGLTNLPASRGIDDPGWSDIDEHNWFR